MSMRGAAAAVVLSALSATAQNSAVDKAGDSQALNLNGPAASKAVEKSISQSALVWLKVFDSANTELKKTEPGFTGKWMLPADPLGIGDKVANPRVTLGKVADVDGYTLKSQAGSGAAGVQAVNQFLVENGFKPALRPGGDIGVSAAAVEEIKFPFAVKATPTTVRIGSEAPVTYEAIKKTDHTYHASDLIPNRVIVELPTTNGVGVYLVKTSAFEQGITSDNVFSLSSKLAATLKPSHTMKADYPAGVILPKVNFHSTTTPKWLIGATAQGTRQRVGQATLETFFKIDENGGESKTAASMMMTKGFSAPRSYIFDEPFLVITVSKKDPTTVLNATIVGPDAFKKVENK